MLSFRVPSYCYKTALRQIAVCRTIYFAHLCHTLSLKRVVFSWFYSIMFFSINIPCKATGFWYLIIGEVYAAICLLYISSPSTLLELSPCTKPASVREKIYYVYTKHIITIMFFIVSVKLYLNLSFFHS